MALVSPETRPRAEAGIGDVLKFTGELDEALPHFETAVALAPDDPYCALDLAEYWLTRAEKAGSDAERAESSKKAMTHFTNAWQLDKSMPETYAMVGRLLLMEGSDLDRAVEMLEEAHYLLPSNLDIQAMLANAYSKNSQQDKSLRLARSVLAWSHDESAASQLARRIIDSHGGKDREAIEQEVVDTSK